jgi:hypothetical protein
MYVDTDNHTEQTLLRSFVTSQIVSSPTRGHPRAIIHVFVHWSADDPYSGSTLVAKSNDRKRVCCVWLQTSLYIVSQSQIACNCKRSAAYNIEIIIIIIIIIYYYYYYYYYYYWRMYY